MASEKRSVVVNSGQGREYPPLVDTFTWFLQGILKSMAFSIKVFFRTKIGHGTFGFWTILIAFIWIRCFLSDPIVIGPLNDFDALVTEMGKKSESKFDGEFGNSYNRNSFSIHLISPKYIRAFKNPKFYFRLFFSFKEWRAFSVLIYSYFILILMLGHFYNAHIRRALNWEKWNSKSRGESFFFSHLIGKRIFNLKITEPVILIIFEPVCAALIGYLLMKINLLSNESVSFYNLGLCLVISSGALFLEELNTFREQRKQIQQILDAEFSTNMLEENIEKYDELETTNQITKEAGSEEVVRFATDNDYQTLRKLLESNNEFN